MTRPKRSSLFQVKCVPVLFDLAGATSAAGCVCQGVVVRSDDAVAPAGAGTHQCCATIL